MAKWGMRDSSEPAGFAITALSQMKFPIEYAIHLVLSRFESCLLFSLIYQAYISLWHGIKTMSVIF